ncbi:MAG: SH3 domain-containing protein [Calditrichaceae bacterium]|nr:SH3 domain-containing protein [Calditrichaceae bacterium]
MYLVKICTFLFFAFLLACNENQNETKTSEESPVVQEKTEFPSVCIWDKGTLRAEPKSSGKWLSSMALGEKVIWTGTESIDSTDKNRKYYKLKLSDGSEGWASEYVIVTNAQPAVVINKTSVYNRPDLLTVTDTEFEEMDIIAVVSSEDNWIEAVGKEKRKKGWIQASAISTNDIDIAVALLASKALLESKTADKIEKIQNILNNTAFNGSFFIDHLKLKLLELQPDSEFGVVEDTMSIE